MNATTEPVGAIITADNNQQPTHTHSRQENMNSKTFGCTQRRCYQVGLNTANHATLEAPHTVVAQQLLPHIAVQKANANE